MIKKTCIAFALAFGLASHALMAQETLAIEKQYAKEIEKLTKTKQVKTAFEFIKAQKDQTTADLITLTEVLAPPFMEDEKGKVFAKMLEEAGVDSIWTDKAGNVIGLRKGTSGESGYVGVDAHLDVVFPEGTDVTVQKVGDTLKAPGIGDDTRALAMLISMLKAMNKADIKTGKDVLIVGSVGEEGLGDLRRDGAIRLDEGVQMVRRRPRPKDL